MPRIPRSRVSPFLRLVSGAALLTLLAHGLALAQANGKLQIHHVNVGQGDGILLISPLGETASFESFKMLNPAIPPPASPPPASRRRAQSRGAKLW